MTQGSVFCVCQVNLKASVARYPHFNRGRVPRLGCSYLSCEGKVSFIIVLGMTFCGSRGDSVPGKHCKIAGKAKTVDYDGKLIFYF